MDIYMQVDATRDIKPMNYLININWQNMAKRGAGVSARDILFAHLC